MAVYKTYIAVNFQEAAQTAAQYLRDAGIFDAVTLEGSVITCTYGGVTAAEFTYSLGRIDVNFGSFSFYAADIDRFWIGSAANGVLLDHHNTYVEPSDQKLYTVAVCRSQSGVPMLVFHELSGSGGRSYTVAADAETPPASESDSTLRTNPYYSNLIGVCTIASGRDTVAAAEKMFRYAERQTNVPNDGLCVVSINGSEYLTDGFCAIQDSRK